jgi:hypothetical protein
MSVSRSLRFQILRRDGNTCRYCGASAPEVKLTVDHVTPTTLGGTDEPSNLVTACEACNGGKSATPPDAALVADVASDALRWSTAIHAAAENMLTDLATRDAARAQFDEKWMDWTYGPDNNRQHVARPSDWTQSVDGFIAAGLPLPVILDCVETAMRNQKVKPDSTFRYVCGIAWRKVAELQNAAKAAVEVPEPALPARCGHDDWIPADVVLDHMPQAEADGYRVEVQVIYDEEPGNPHLGIANIDAALMGIGQICAERLVLARALIWTRIATGPWPEVWDGLQNYEPGLENLLTKIAPGDDSQLLARTDKRIKT